MFIALLVKEKQNVTITCKTAANSSITWKFGNIDLKDIGFKEALKEDGHRLNLSEVGNPMSGEYSCWSEGQNLYSIHLLLEANYSSEIFFVISHSFHESCKYSSLCIYHYNFSLVAFTL